jgi:DNA-binding transcriptional MerR regulator
MPISQFSEMCQLSPQTLRFYHSAGLLVPARVDEQTGYRSYDFGQIERAMLIATLRRAGLSVRHVRQALDDGDTTPDLLTAHREALRRQREQEDEALDDAQAFATDWPQVRRYHVPDTVVVSALVPGRADDVIVAARTRAAAHELTKSVESCGATVTGTPWKAYALDTPERKEKIWTRDGPDWLVTVPVTADDDFVAAVLHDAVTVTTFPAREEVSVIMPGRETMAKLGTALNTLVTHALEQDCVPDLGRLRHLMHDGGVEIALTIRAASDEPLVP